MLNITVYTGRIHEGDNIEWMQKMPPESVDLIATDPPYGYSFMGKDWDKAVPSTQTWEECLRILKPGAFLYVMSSPRQDVLAQMIYRIGEVGFDTSFTSIYWTYANGFPKAQNIGKAIDKKLGANREIISGTSKPTEYSGKFDQRSSSNRQKDMGAVSDQAKALDGSYVGFQPKPAVEIVIVAMKPLSEKTYMAQAMNNGKGVTWLDNCKIPLATSEKQKTVGWAGRNGFTNTHEASKHGGLGSGLPRPQSGRFPANILVEDDVLNNVTISKSAGGPANNYPTKADIQVTGFKDYPNLHTSGAHHNDPGSFSRYFSLDAWWEKTIHESPDNIKATFPFIITPKASKNEKNKGCEDLEAKEQKITNQYEIPRKDGSIREIPAPRKNHHPTVKPIKLMSYLITLGSRPGDIILDPFSGSGSTSIAAKITGREYIGIDQSGEYCNIARHRIDAWGAPHKTKSSRLLFIYQNKYKPI